MLISDAFAPRAAPPASRRPFFFGARGPQSEDIRPFTVHTTWTWVGMNWGKASRMREFGFWAANAPQYYSPENGILSFDSSVVVSENDTLHMLGAAADDGASADTASQEEQNQLGKRGGSSRRGVGHLVMKQQQPAASAAAPPPSPPHDELLDKELPVLLSAWAVASLLDRKLVGRAEGDGPLSHSWLLRGARAGALGSSPPLRFS